MILAGMGAGEVSIAATSQDETPPRPGPAMEEVEVTYDTPPSPGMSITLGIDGTVPPDTVYKWTQVEGPMVAIDDPSQAKLRITVPEGSSRLVFHLQLKYGGRERFVRVVVPIGEKVDPNAPRADAGDDQVGLVGRRITLNGSRSTPRTAGFRWIQTAGPTTSQPIQEGPYYSFVPRATGTYRFALVIASESAISPPDEVVVIVGELPSANRSAPADPPISPALTRLVVGSEGISGPMTVRQIADAFEALSERAPLYSTFNELTVEMARRLDAVIPPEPIARQTWSQAMFTPLSQLTTAEMLAVGVDLRLPQGHGQPLTQAQRDRLQALFRDYARAFRSRTTVR
ncbi:MAG: hypothetical protein U0800_14325 [Isosphaeraceae bacterium]